MCLTHRKGTLQFLATKSAGLVLAHLGLILSQAIKDLYVQCDIVLLAVQKGNRGKLSIKGKRKREELLGLIRVMIGGPK